MVRFALVAVTWVLLVRVGSAAPNTVVSAPIRILDTGERSSYYDRYGPSYRQDPYRGEPTMSYVIYDRAPGVRDRGGVPTRDWHTQFSGRKPVAYLAPQRPTMSYESTYSNVIKVFDDPRDYNTHHFPKPFGYKKYYGDRNTQASESRPVAWNYPQYDVHYPAEETSRLLYPSEKIPDNFPVIFSPNSEFGVIQNPQPAPKLFYPNTGYNTHTVNFAEEGKKIPLGDRQSHGKACNYIRLNNQGFPVQNEGCGRSEDIPLSAPEYPEYPPSLPNEKVPMEHRLHSRNRDPKKRNRRESEGLVRVKHASSGYGLGYSPYGYTTSGYGTNMYSNNGYNNNNEYYNRYNNNNNEYDNRYNNNEYYNRNNPRSYGENGYSTSDDYYPSYGNSGRPTGGYRSQSSDESFGARGGGYGASRSERRRRPYNDERYYEEEAQSSDESTSRGLTSFLTNGGNRDKAKRLNRQEESEESEEEDTRKKENGRRKESSSRKEESSRGGSRYGSKSKNRDRDEDDDDEEEERDSRRGGGRNSRRRGSSRRREEEYGYRSRGYGGRSSGNEYGRGGMSGSRGSMDSYSGGSYGSRYGDGSYGGDFEGQQGRPFSMYG